MYRKIGGTMEFLKNIEDHPELVLFVVFLFLPGMGIIHVTLNGIRGIVREWRR